MSTHFANTLLHFPSIPLQTDVRNIQTEVGFSLSSLCSTSPSTGYNASASQYHQQHLHEQQQQQSQLQQQQPYYSTGSYGQSSSLLDPSLIIDSLHSRCIPPTNHQLSTSSLFPFDLQQHHHQQQQQQQQSSIANFWLNKSPYSDVGSDDIHSTISRQSSEHLSSAALLHQYSTPSSVSSSSSSNGSDQESPLGNCLGGKGGDKSTPASGRGPVANFYPWMGIVGNELKTFCKLNN